MGLNGWGNIACDLTAHTDNEGVDLEKNVLHLNSHYCKILKIPFESPESETEEENVCKDETQTNSQSKTCEFCNKTLADQDELFFDELTDNKIACEECYNKKRNEALEYWKLPITVKDTHKCEKCEGEQAEFLVLDNTTKTQKYVCPTCFSECKVFCEEGGRKFYNNGVLGESKEVS